MSRRAVVPLIVSVLAAVVGADEATDNGVAHGTVWIAPASQLYMYLADNANAVWNDQEDELYSVIEDHFVRHLSPFAAYAQ